MEKLSIDFKGSTNMMMMCRSMQMSEAYFRANYLIT